MGEILVEGIVGAVAVGGGFGGLVLSWCFSLQGSDSCTVYPPQSRLIKGGSQTPTPVPEQGGLGGLCKLCAEFTLELFGICAMRVGRLGEKRLRAWA